VEGWHLIWAQGPRCSEPYQGGTVLFDMDAPERSDSRLEPLPGHCGRSMGARCQTEIASQPSGLRQPAVMDHAE